MNPSKCCLFPKAANFCPPPLFEKNWGDCIGLSSLVQCHCRIQFNANVLAVTGQPMGLKTNLFHHGRNGLGDFFWCIASLPHKPKYSNFRSSPKGPRWSPQSIQKSNPGKKHLISATGFDFIKQWCNEPRMKSKEPYSLHRSKCNNVCNGYHH